MAVDMFLKIDGIPGESTDDRHKDEIDILSYAWGESQPGTGMHDRAGRYLHGQDGNAGLPFCHACQQGVAQVIFRQIK